MASNVSRPATAAPKPRARDHLRYLANFSSCQTAAAGSPERPQAAQAPTVCYLPLRPLRPRHSVDHWVLSAFAPMLIPSKRPDSQW